MAPPKSPRETLVRESQVPRLDQVEVGRLRRALLGWYDKNQRVLPWRAVGGFVQGVGQGAVKPRVAEAKLRVDPYHVLVSEFMLQQTQVATVIPYFNRFVAQFPTVADLAAAPPQRVLRAWQGLGYYRRVQNLQAAARRIVEDHQGIVPGTVEELHALPGVGRYTAGAVASIAYGVRAAAVDGNVGRVLARLLAIERPLGQPAVVAALWEAAEQLVGVKRPGDFNQAMMELGATVCLPRQPKCEGCPVARFCRALAEGKVDQLPVKARRGDVPRVEHQVIAIAEGEKYLFEQRPEKGLWSRMWQLPTIEETGRTSRPKVRNWLATRLDVEYDGPKRVGVFTHRTTHRLIRFTVWRAAVSNRPARAPAGLWRLLDNVEDLPLAIPQIKALALVKRADQQADRGEVIERN